MIFVFRLELVFKTRDYYRKFKKIKQSFLKKVSINDVYEVERLLKKKMTKRKIIKNKQFNI